MSGNLEGKDEVEAVIPDRCVVGLEADIHWPSNPACCCCIKLSALCS
jgi:hypothetical protein